VDAKTVVWLVQVPDHGLYSGRVAGVGDNRLALDASPGSIVRAGPAGAVWRVLDVERIEVDVPESHPEDRPPYITDAETLGEACRRSAQIDRDELATMPPFGQPGYGPETADRVEQLRLSARLWEEQAERAEVRTVATNAFRVTLEAVDPHDVPVAARLVELPLPVMLLDGSEPAELRSRREVKA
jgi:hypothetical protein